MDVIHLRRGADLDSSKTHCESRSSPFGAEFKLCYVANCLVVLRNRLLFHPKKAFASLMTGRVLSLVSKLPKASVLFRLLVANDINFFNDDSNGVGKGMIPYA
ncbi:unnamed protein product [Sphenostylis stenocarpa]|uniref:Uncharacterized protein n=1 Tax=Sphenostylis stenocarpa TaxID=92480 RepID=A0AA86W366_9FABA|nr:unnamed protein product [Sphenostylis stenocarpa]